MTVRLVRRSSIPATASLIWDCPGAGEAVSLNVLAARLAPVLVRVCAEVEVFSSIPNEAVNVTPGTLTATVTPSVPLEKPFAAAAAWAAGTASPALPLFT